MWLFNPFYKNTVEDSSYLITDNVSIEKDEDAKNIGFVILYQNSCLFGSLLGNTEKILGQIPVQFLTDNISKNSSLNFTRSRDEAISISKKVTEFFINDKEIIFSGIIIACCPNRSTDIFFRGNNLGIQIIKNIHITCGGEKGFTDAVKMYKKTIL
jgi:hypothetical protein